VFFLSISKKNIPLFKKGKKARPKRIETMPLTLLCCFCNKSYK
jgi:hypothetical protein